jgi:hypothetical protein
VTRVTRFRLLVVELGLLAVLSPFARAQNACDLNQDGGTNIVDAQWATNMLFGLMPCTAAINGVGVCNVVVVQRVIVAATGGTCVVDGAGVPHDATLSWTASASPNVSGYNVYRRSNPTGSYAKVNSALITGVTYTDTTVQSGQTYYYVATAVNSSNVESGYSNEVQANIP